MEPGKALFIPLLFQSAVRFVSRRLLHGTLFETLEHFLLTYEVPVLEFPDEIGANF